MGKPTCKHLFHRCIIVWPLDCTDLEFTVIAAFRFSIFIDHHGTYRFHTTGIGNIISFHPADTSYADPLPHLINRTNRAQFFPFYLFTVLSQDQIRISGCQLYQPFFFSLFRHYDLYLLTLFLGQPLFYKTV